MAEDWSDKPLFVERLEVDQIIYDNSVKGPFVAHLRAEATVGGYHGPIKAEVPLRLTAEEVEAIQSLFDGITERARKALLGLHTPDPTGGRLARDGLAGEIIYHYRL